ncbi:hypothetical protein ASPWEDRAFT_341898 [Aspergillus wentii DTO 134E9]|uniref:F-box domain-containing protein n=1 Tax=Aspergillus wentii DTO 134E9 TaxID=1073089 RepID=A0A1L9RV50_ASPWE|nr:uncharacterized protein ASPWEDRAFT_341898 [Aspergillus wentii DTO 134E9]OJJ38763.1 hypothetical protein ASPWEDRAFT_341898 [Aspergillus wentii DTO 134E9]
MYFPSSLQLPHLNPSTIRKMIQIWRIIQKLLCRKITESILFELPLELLFAILWFLPLPDKVRLTLTCKDLYHLLFPLLPADDLRFPRLLPYRPYCDRNYTRADVLIALEDTHWAYCQGCQKLHPREEFPTSPAKFMNDPLTRYCAISSGLVDLCPCIVITFRDRLRIEDYLLGRKKRSCGYIDKGVLVSVPHAKGRYLVHECYAYRNVEMAILLYHADEKMFICTRYSIPNDTRAVRTEDIFICPHRTLSKYVHAIPSPACRSCNARVVKLTSSKNPDAIVVQVTRCLGKRPEKDWMGLGEDWCWQTRLCVYLPISGYLD